MTIHSMERRNFRGAVYGGKVDSHNDPVLTRHLKPSQMDPCWFAAVDDDSHRYGFEMMPDAKAALTVLVGRWQGDCTFNLRNPEKIGPMRSTWLYAV